MDDVGMRQIIFDNLGVIIMVVGAACLGLGIFISERTDEEDPTPEQLEDACTRFHKEWEGLKKKKKVRIRKAMLNAYFAWSKALDDREGEYV